jgi:hypothetical protein
LLLPCACKHTPILATAQGETVPYIICIDRSGGAEGAEAGGGASGKGLAQRAYHIDEVRAPGAQLEVDASYYLSQQARALAFNFGFWNIFQQTHSVEDYSMLH